METTAGNDLLKWFDLTPDGRRFIGSFEFFYAA